MDRLKGGGTTIILYGGKKMEFTINEKITLLFAVKQRRRELMTMVKNKIDYLKSLELDVTEDRDISYLVSEVNLCTRVMAKIWSY